jgi:hypothetical protein
MTPKEFKTQRDSLLAKLESYKEQIDKEYTQISRRFTESNCPVEKEKVYELTRNGVKRRGFKRFVIYDIEPRVILNSPSIIVGGWWLDKDNVPSKWDNMTVLGAVNSAVFELSGNQETKPHPESKYKDL